MTCCDQYFWLVIVGGVFSFAAAFGIGANDCANCFATSVGSKALTLKQALVCSAIFEFSGAVLLGSNVADTIRGGLIEVDLFAANPELLMLGMACVCLSTAIWLITATMFGLPVSTTHSVIGGIIGFSVVAKGFRSVQWGNLAFIISSWFVSPVVTGLLSASFFFALRYFVLRHVQSLDRALRTYPLIVGFTIAVNSYYIFYYGPALAELMPAQWIGMLSAFGVGALLSLGLQLTFINCWLRPKLLRETDMNGPKQQQQERRSSSGGNSSTLGVSLLSSSNDQVDRTRRLSSTQFGDDPSAPADATSFAKLDGDSDSVSASGDQQSDEEIPPAVGGGRMDTHASLRDKNSSIAKMHAAAEVYPRQTERVFTYLQVFTACVGAFGHGANDVSNAVAPFATVVGIYRTAAVDTTEPVPAWVLAFGGGGIVLGLACLGYKVIKSIGVDMIKVTPSRGFVIELSSATVIIFGSVIGLPLSTTHCQVGGTVGVGMLEGAKDGVNWWLFAKVATAWVFTIAVTAAISGGLYAFVVFSPSLDGYEGNRAPEEPPGRLNQTLLGSYYHDVSGV